MKGGYIKLHYKFLEWEWYDNPKTKILFLHLLLLAQYKDYKYCGKTLKPGQVVTGRLKLAKELNMSEREIRTALEHLKSTREIDQQTTSQYSIITINNWDKYQGNDQQTTTKKEDSILRILSKEEEFFNLDSSWIDLIKTWLEYKKSKKQSYKNERSLRAFINKLLTLSQKDLLKAKSIIEESMANNWNGIFPLEKEKTHYDKYESPLFLG